MKEINLMTWYADRELDFCPKHFTKTTTVLTDENKLWIYEKLVGRFHVHTLSDPSSLFFFGDSVPYFEDPQEAVMYELVWS